MGNPPSIRDEIPMERLLKARLTAARIVARYGERFLPIFQRIDKEIRVRESRDKALSRALAMADF